MELKNCMEISVEKYVDEVMENVGTCLCEKCRLDLMAIALNNLAPKYVVTREGLLFSKVKALELQYDITIISELTKAAELVKKDRRHHE